MIDKAIEHTPTLVDLYQVSLDCWKEDSVVTLGDDECEISPRKFLCYTFRSALNGVL